MNYRIIRFMGGVSAVIAHILPSFGATSVADNTYTTTNKCGTDASQIYVTNGSRYTCTYTAINVTCAVGGGSTGTGTGTSGLTPTGTGEGANMLDMVIPLQPVHSTWVYLNDSQTADVSWCSGGHIFVAFSGQTPQWETNIPTTPGAVTICCSKSVAWATTHPTPDTSRVATATIHVPNIQFQGCARGARRVSATEASAGQTAVCISGVSAGTGLPYGYSVAVCCYRCGATNINSAGCTTLSGNYLEYANDSSLSCPGAGYEYASGTNDCAVKLSGSTSQTDSSGTYNGSQCYWTN